MMTRLRAHIARSFKVRPQKAKHPSGAREDATGSIPNHQTENDASEKLFVILTDLRSRYRRHSPVDFGPPCAGFVISGR
jgi:hypothetical protein